MHSTLLYNYRLYIVHKKSRTYSSCIGILLFMLESSSPYSPLFIPWQSPFYSLLLWVWPCLIPHLNGYTQDLSFYDGLMSLSIMSFRFIHVVADSGISFFLRVNYVLLSVWTIFSLSILLLMNICVVSVFLAIVNK